MASGEKTKPHVHISTEPRSKRRNMTNETWPVEKDANEYLEKHKILELFNNMTSQLIFHRPDIPKIFLVEMLEQLQKSKSTHMNYPCLFDDSNVQSVYGMLDPNNSGKISLVQYKEAMQTLGVLGYDENPVGGETNQITFETFLKEARGGLNKAAATFIRS